MWFEILAVISIIVNIIHIIKYLKSITQIEDKTYDKLQNYLNTSKPDKLFKDYYNYFESDYKNPKMWNEQEHKYVEYKKVDDQIITIEFNENYKNYHVGKSCVSDIINNLNYSFKELMKPEEQPKLVYSESKWYLETVSRKIDLSKELFNNVAINFHINYIDLNQIAKTVKREDLDKLSSIFKKLTTLNSSEYIFYDIYDNKFEFYQIKAKTWNDYINECLNMHYKMSIDSSDTSGNKNDSSDTSGIRNEINKIINSFHSKARKYNWMFKNNELCLFNKTSNKMALPNPDGLIINRDKVI